MTARFEDRWMIWTDDEGEADIAAFWDFLKGPGYVAFVPPLVVESELAYRGVAL